MPQNTPQEIPGNTATPEAAQAAFADFLKNVLGQSSTAAPGTGQPGTVTPAVAGGLPPMMTPASRLSTPPLPVVPPQQAPTPMRQTAPAGTTFSNKAARNENTATTFTNALVSAIEKSKDKKEQDNIARAQNTMNIYLHAISQNDLATANLYASDPKITASWEKYLKQEYKRVPGASQGKPEPVTSGPLAGMGGMPTAAPPATAGINEPGGIAVAQDKTPEGQIKAAQLAAAQKMISTGQISDAALAAPILGERAGLSPQEDKQANLVKFGLATSSSELSQIDANTRAHMATTMADLTKYIVNQQQMTDRTKMTTTGRTADVKYAADEAYKRSVDVAKLHVQAVKDAMALKPDARQEALYKAQMDTYGKMASEIDKQLGDPKMAYQAGIFTDADKKAAIARRDGYLKQQADIRAESEGHDIMMKMFPELMGGVAGAGASDAADNPPASQTTEPQ